MKSEFRYSFFFSYVMLIADDIFSFSPQAVSLFHTQRMITPLLICRATYLIGTCAMWPSIGNHIQGKIFSGFKEKEILQSVPTSFGFVI